MAKVTVIVPTYNRADLINQTLESVLNQDYDNWECLVVDDHSTDHTKQIVNEYIQKDDRFKYFLNNRTKGAQGARNTGIEQSQGEYLIFLDSDDLLSAKCLSGRIKFTEENKDFDFYCFATGVFEHIPRDTPYLWNYLNKPEDDLARFLRLDMPWHTSGVLWKKEVLNLLDGWDETLSCWQDWDLHLRALLNKNLSYIKSSDNQIDTYYRQLTTHVAISKSELSNNSIQSKEYLIEKYITTVPAISDRANLEYGRLIYRIARQFADVGEKEYALLILQKYMFKLNFSSVYKQSWYAYFKHKYHSVSPALVKKLVGIVPRIFSKMSLISYRRTHLTAVLSSGTNLIG